MIKVYRWSPSTSPFSRTKYAEDIDWVIAGDTWTIYVRVDKHIESAPILRKTLNNNVWDLVARISHEQH